MLFVENLNISFLSEGAFVPVTQGVGFGLEAGRTLGIVGESGSGKSVSALAIMGLLPRRTSRVSAARLEFSGRDLRSIGERQWRSLRGREMAMVFQDPMTSLNPLMRCGEQIAESIVLHQGKGRARARTLAVELLEQMGIPNAPGRYFSYPFELSGGMRQRVMIAVALACRPRLLIADEPTTALDVTVQAQILRLIRDLQQRFGMALILITHDLGVVQDMVEDLIVMYAGRVVERGASRRILQHPSHPYTRGLIHSIPSLERRVRRLYSIEGVVPRPDEEVPGCRFHPRCSMALPECRAGIPDLRGEDGQFSACIRREELQDRRLSPGPA